MAHAGHRPLRSPMKLMYLVRSPHDRPAKKKLALYSPQLTSTSISSIKCAMSDDLCPPFRLLFITKKKHRLLMSVIKQSPILVTLTTKRCNFHL